MNQKLKPARLPTPGRILNRELEARGWEKKYLAKLIKLSVQSINKIINGTKEINLEIALKLAQAFGTSVEFWINLETKYKDKINYVSNKAKEM